MRSWPRPRRWSRSAARPFRGITAARRPRPHRQPRRPPRGSCRSPSSPARPPSNRPTCSDSAGPDPPPRQKAASHARVDRHAAPRHPAAPGMRPGPKARQRAPDAPRAARRNCCNGCRDFSTKGQAVRRLIRRRRIPRTRGQIVPPPARRAPHRRTAARDGTGARIAGYYWPSIRCRANSAAQDRRPRHHWRSIRTTANGRAERRLGELLRETERAPAGRAIRRWCRAATRRAAGKPRSANC